MDQNNTNKNISLSKSSIWQISIITAILIVLFLGLFLYFSNVKADDINNPPEPLTGEGDFGVWGWIWNTISSLWEKVYTDYKINVAVQDVESGIYLHKYSGTEKENFNIEIRKTIASKTEPASTKICLIPKKTLTDKDTYYKELNFYTDEEKSEIISKDNLEIEKTLITINEICYPVDESTFKYLQIGENTIIIKNESAKQVNVDFEDGTNASVKLYWDVNGDGSNWNNTINELTASWDGERSKIVGHHNESENIERYKFVYQYEQGIRELNGRYFFDNEIPLEINNEDICDRTLINGTHEENRTLINDTLLIELGYTYEDLYENQTLEDLVSYNITINITDYINADCEIELSNDNKTLSLTFFSDSFIDPLLEIQAVDAWRLNSSRDVQENVFYEIEEIDYYYKEIVTNDYIRVQFETNLTSINDITIVANSSGGSVEVYEKDEDVLLATFPTITENGRYQIFLDNLVGEQDTFDLKVINANVSFDYITDPVTNYQYTLNITINSSFIDNDLYNWTLVIDEDFLSILTSENGPLDADGTRPMVDGGADLQFSDADGNRIALDVRTATTNNNPASGNLELAVKVPFVNSTNGTDTTIIMYWGNTTTASQPAVDEEYGQYDAYHLCITYRTRFLYVVLRRGSIYVFGSSEVKASPTSLPHSSRMPH